jgi:hypothetical protein
MAGFAIDFTGDFDDEDPMVAIGQLLLGDDQEFFSSTLTFWGVADYRASWAAGLRRTLDGAAVSCLATSVTDPAVSNFVEVWPLYRAEEGDVVYVQNRLLFLDQLPGAFDPAAPWASVSPRTTVTEDGDQISEWHLSLAVLQEFLAAQ